LNIAGNLTVQGDAAVHINNETIVGGTGGMIGGNATIDVSAANISTTGNFSETLSNNVGSIGGDAAINVSSANITANSMTALINNLDGGTIGGNANINFNLAGDLATQSNIDVEVSNFPSAQGNPASAIGGAASVTANIAGNLTAQGTAFFQ